MGGVAFKTSSDLAFAFVCVHYREKNNRTGSADDDEDQHLAKTSAASASLGDTDPAVSKSGGGGKEVNGVDGTAGSKTSTESTTAVVAVPPDDTACPAVASANSMEIVGLASGDSVSEVNAPSKPDKIAVTGM